MKRSILDFCLLPLFVFILGCGAPNYAFEDPFKTPRNQFISRIHKIGLMPIKVHPELEMLDDERNVFDSFLVQEMTAAGFQITKIATQESDSLQNVLKIEVGGLFDPNSGELNLPNLNKWRRSLLTELKNRHNVDAVLFCFIDIVTAVVKHDNAKWHGTSQGVGRGSFLKAISGVSHSGTVPATVLLVQLRDVENMVLYQHSGGIQVLEKIGASGGPVEISMDELFKYEDRNLKAVQLALYPLFGKPYSSEMGKVKIQPDDFRSP